jgi:hypothetical protein
LGAGFVRLRPRPTALGPQIALNVRCGGQGANDMASFAEAKKRFLGSLFMLADALPCDDPFSRLFRTLDPDQLRDAFRPIMA